LKHDFETNKTNKRFERFLASICVDLLFFARGGVSIYRTQK
jgi:hypothetical protein